MANKQETAIQNAIRLELSKIGIVRRNNVGSFLTVYGNRIAIGLPGEADITLFARGGETIFIEIKTPTGRQSAQQKRFQKAVENLGYEYIIMRCVEEAQALVRRLKNDDQRNRNANKERAAVTRDGDP